MYSSRLLSYKSRRDKLVSSTNYKDLISHRVPDVRECANTSLNRFEIRKM